VTPDEWNDRYRTREEIDAEPAQLLVDAVRDIAPGRALDLACGAGRNAVWLARKGWEVAAVDSSSEAIRLVREYDVAIDARAMDLEREDALPFGDASFDLVIILFYLHRPLFAEAKRVLRDGGLVVTAARTRRSFAAARGELATYFRGWEILHERHAEIAELVVRKPVRSAR
jgi:SAM-dependent methyltransferase